MKLLSRLSFVFFVSLALTSCSKSRNDISGPFPVTYPDTLSAGWTKVKMNQYIGIFYGGDVFFNSASTGFASDNNSGIFKSTDGGSTWNEVFRAGGRSLSAANIAMTADNKAFFVGNVEDSIFRTTDLGATITGYGITGARISDIFFGDNNTGLCTTTQGLLNTTDAGVTWNNIASLPGYTNTTNSMIYMLGGTNAWVCYDNKILHANGSLASFTLDSLPVTSTNFVINSVFATSPTTVYVSTQTGYLFGSSNGGHSFSQVAMLNNITGYYGSDLHFIDANTGYMSLGSRIYKTTNGGVTWSVVVALGAATIAEIHFVDASHGWACTSDGYILKFN